MSCEIRRSNYIRLGKYPKFHVRPVPSGTARTMSTSKSLAAALHRSTPILRAPALHVWIKHFQGSAAGIDLVVMGQIGKPFQDAEQVLVPAATPDLDVASAPLRTKRPKPRQLVTAFGPQQAAQVPGPQPAVRCRAADRGWRFARLSANRRPAWSSQAVPDHRACRGSSTAGDLFLPHLSRDGSPTKSWVANKEEPGFCYISLSPRRRWRRLRAVSSCRARLIESITTPPPI
jgi:hypothetical protein